jgi:hypothetical protein
MDITSVNVITLVASDQGSGPISNNLLSEVFVMSLLVSPDTNGAIVVHSEPESRIRGLAYAKRLDSGAASPQETTISSTGLKKLSPMPTLCESNFIRLRICHCGFSARL